MDDIINMQGLDLDDRQSKEGKKYNENASLKFIRKNSRGDGQGLSRRAAVSMITDYWKEKKQAIQNKDESVLDDNVAITFDKEALLLMLSQSDCDKIRFYFCKNHENNTSLVMVGARKNDKDISCADERGSIVPCDNSQLNSVMGSRDAEEETLFMEVGGPKTFGDYFNATEEGGDFQASSNPNKFDFNSSLGFMLKDFFKSH